MRFRVWTKRFRVKGYRIEQFSLRHGKDTGTMKRRDKARFLGMSVITVLLLGSGACATEQAGSGSGPEPVLHPPGGSIEFSRRCADEDAFRVKAYARMESSGGRARAVVEVLAGFPAEGGGSVRVDVRLQRLKIDGGGGWRNAPYTIRLLARGGSSAMEGPEAGSFLAHEKGRREFRADGTGRADWITFVEPGEEDGNLEDFYNESPDLGFDARDLGVKGPDGEFGLGLEVRNGSNGEALRLHGPLVRIPERVWAMNPPDPRPLGLLETLDPTEEGGLPRFLGRAWKYRKCIGERRAAKRFLGPYVPDT